MTSLQYQRGAAMVERVRLEAGFRLGADAAGRVARAVELALRHREHAMLDDHDPRYMHSARNVLVLLSDAACGDADTLAAAAFFDSVDAALCPPPERLLDVAGPAAAALLLRVPRAPDDEVMEALVTAEPAAALIALADRLDHARHLKFRDDLDWRTFHEAVRTAWTPAALRICPPIGRRLDRWADAFRRTLLLSRPDQPDTAGAARGTGDRS